MRSAPYSKISQTYSVVIVKQNVNSTIKNGERFTLSGLVLFSMNTNEKPINDIITPLVVCRILSNNARLS